MSWRVAPCLDQLLKEINAKWPNRSKVSDGSIGDPAHSARVSDHNPANGIVHARDFTNDPDHGANMRLVWNAILARKDPRVKYMIFEGKIMSGPAGPSPWIPRTYDGNNGHYHHIHVSCRYGGTYENDVREWLGASKEDWFDMASKQELAEVVQESIGKPYAPGLTVLKILTEKDGDQYVDSIKLILDRLDELEAKIDALKTQ